MIAIPSWARASEVREVKGFVCGSEGVGPEEAAAVAEAIVGAVEEEVVASEHEDVAAAGEVDSLISYGHASPWRKRSRLALDTLRVPVFKNCSFCIT